MMDLPMTHVFSPERHIMRHECEIHKKPGNHNSETTRIVPLVEATEKKTLKIGVTWKIKHLVENHKGIFHEFQFDKPKNTCISSIILKTLTIDSVNVTKTPAVLHDIDGMKAFDLVIRASQF
jgi:hypothetical protein